MYALSYDEVDALATYTNSFGADFPLLSDPDSEIIADFGILNTLIDPDDHPWYGIPFPGTYVIGADGVVTHKFFENSLFFRPAADVLLRAARGEDVELTPIAQPPIADATLEVATLEVDFDGDVVRAGVVRDLVVRLQLPTGHHVYGEPVPEGMVATTVDIEPQTALSIGQAVFPETSALTLATGETLQVYEADADGAVTIRVPLAHLGRSLTQHDDGSSTLDLVGTVRWQSCDDNECHLPRTESFSLTVPAEGHNRVTPDWAPHFQKMMSRRTDRSLAEMFRSITGPDA